MYSNTINFLFIKKIKKLEIYRRILIHILIILFLY